MVLDKLHAKTLVDEQAGEHEEGCTRNVEQGAHRIGQNVIEPGPQLSGHACEGFRMPADDGRGREHRGWGPASESLQGTKPREVARGRAEGAMGI